MKPPFAFEARTRLAGRAMEHVRGFVALIAPWIAKPEDLRMSPVVLTLIVAIFIIGSATVGYGGVMAIRELLPHREAEK